MGLLKSMLSQRCAKSTQYHGDVQARPEIGVVALHPRHDAIHEAELRAIDLGVVLLGERGCSVALEHLYRSGITLLRSASDHCAWTTLLVQSHSDGQERTPVATVEST